MAITQPKQETDSSRSTERTNNVQQRESTDSAYGSGGEDEDEYLYRRADGSVRSVSGDYAYWNGGASSDDEAAAMMRSYEAAQARSQSQTKNPERTREAEYEATMRALDVAAAENEAEVRRILVIASRAEGVPYSRVFWRWLHSTQGRA